MQKTQIEWTDFSWNPIKGLCPVDCKLPDGKSYCYARRIYNRFEGMLDDTGPVGYLAEWELEQPIKRKKPTKIFVCSTYELFHSPDKFARDEIFKIIEKCPQHIFQILTKFPENIDRPIPDNVWLGITITGNTHKDYIRATEFGSESRKAKVQFISYEPLLEEPIQNIPNVDWIIIGRLTGYGKKYDPKREWIEKIIRTASDAPPIFLKNNLKDIWGEPLIQEFPDV